VLCKFVVGVVFCVYQCVLRVLYMFICAFCVSAWCVLSVLESCKWSGTAVKL